jgi:hypothetical protein
VNSLVGGLLCTILVFSALILYGESPRRGLGMRALVIGLLFVGFAVLGPACWEPTCKNPMRGAPNGQPGIGEGVLVQCHAVSICPEKGRGDVRRALEGAEDAQIIDRGSSDDNEDACKARAMERNVSSRCGVEVSPKVICLDPPGSNGCGSNPGDSTVIIVGGTGSGDFKSDPQGTGGTNDYGGGDGAGGQGDR